MKPAKIRTLAVRPFRSADLAFAVSGLLGRQSDGATLGALVRSGRALLTSVQQELGARSVGPKAPGRVTANAASIDKALVPDALFVLRNERLGAELDQAIASHHAQYLHKFADSSAVGPILRKENAARVLDFQNLEDLFTTRHQELAQSYSQSHSSVVSSTTSTSSHQNDTPAVVRTFSALNQLQTAPYGITIKDGGIPNPPMKHQVDEVLVSPRTFVDGKGFQAVAQELNVSFVEGAHPKVSGVLTQVSETTQRPVLTLTELPEHAHPSIDESIGSVSALGEIDASQQDRLVRGMRLAHYEDVIDNEDQVLLMDVRKHQLAYVETYMLPPFTGRITAIYKDLGEYVQAGEPVLRLEDDRKLLLVGLVQFKGLVSIGDPVALQVRNLFEGGDDLKLMGRIVSVRGHEADDDEWDILIEVANADGQQVTRKDTSLSMIHLPLNLQFDRFETELTIGKA
ncbi:HlyD family secretion protein [Candidatus Accumulibacter sp. ACC012]|uniref:HlyD family secretion protein n=1 Tax=Candidatus Accumulibacter sp. ACC012 TaxID=2823332 RepID=UPI0025BB46FD|nr:HlyD family secretion protein [Candidatus Accumulibacter sp. ACC012]